MIAGKDSVNFGEAKNSWLTGTAAWNYVAITNWILGIRPTYRGLELEPKIPSHWKSVTIKRIFRGVTYNITIKRIGDGNHSSLYIGDKLLKRNIIPLTEVKQQEIDVKVIVE